MLKLVYEIKIIYLNKTRHYFISYFILGMGINLDESSRSRLDEDGYTTMDSEPLDMPPFCGGLQNMQSTYV
jgi:hypothetical protein